MSVYMSVYLSSVFLAKSIVKRLESRLEDISLANIISFWSSKSFQKKVTSSWPGPLFRHTRESMNFLDVLIVRQ